MKMPVPGSFSMRPLGALSTALLVNLRSSIKVQPQGGRVVLPFDPGKADYVIFFKVGLPVAVAAKKEITRANGDYLYHYESVRWLTDEKPEEADYIKG